MKRNYKYFKPFLKHLIVLDEELNFIPKVIVDSYNMLISVIDDRNDFHRLICECKFPDNIDTYEVVDMISDAYTHCRIYVY